MGVGWGSGVWGRLVRSRVSALAAGALLVALAVHPGAALAGPTTPDRGTDTATVADGGQSAQTYGVGWRQLDLVDPTRPTQADPSRGLPAKPDRTVQTTVLYPTDADPTTPSQPDAPTADGRFPLVVFSHGFTANGPAYVPFMEPLVRRGYVVALPTFPLSSGAGGMLVDVVNQPGDVSFVIDELFALSRTTDGWLDDRINTRRVAAAGHSLGAVTTFGLVYGNADLVDPRVKAAIAISGRADIWPGLANWPETPLLLIHGQWDAVVPVSGSNVAFENAATGRTWYLRLAEADHIGVLFGEDGELAQEAMARFLDAKLKGRWRPLEAMEQLAADSGRAEWLVDEP
jgi:alpha-beta hydrolase superfamily lysophospholipase